MFQVTHHEAVSKKLQARWCGPAAMSAVTGLTAEECAAAINRARGLPAYYQTQTVGVAVIGSVLRDLGFKVSKFRDNAAPTIRGFATNRSSTMFFRPIIAWTRNHFVALQEKTLVDNMNEAGIPWRDYPKLRSKVLGWYTVEVDRSCPQGLDGWNASQHSHYARKVRLGVAS